jgi:hypothetical protein
MVELHKRRAAMLMDDLGYFTDVLNIFVVVNAQAHVPGLIERIFHDRGFYDDQTYAASG